MSSRTVFPRIVTLVEAFRRILRAIYPDRQALADEIKSYAWLYFDFNRRCVDPDRGEERAGEGREDEEKAFNEAHKRLGDSVRQEHGKFRLRGALNPSSPLEDIDPADAKVSRPDVFNGRLHVFDGDKNIKTYYRVHCYEADVDRCVAELRSETKHAKRTSEAEFKKFVEDYKTSLGDGKPPTEGVFIEAAKAKGIYRPRQDFRDALDTLGPRRPGHPTKSREK